MWFIVYRIISLLQKDSSSSLQLNTVLTESIVAAQLKAIAGKQLLIVQVIIVFYYYQIIKSSVAIAYEPVWAIGTGQ